VKRKEEYLFWKEYWKEKDMIKENCLEREEENKKRDGK